MCHPSRLAAFCALLILSACGGGAGRYPALMPSDLILAEPALPDHAGIAAASPDQADAATETRGAALRDRAASLQGPVIDPETRARMQRARR
ncbi:hypothetical protein [Paracoccus marinaquae]|uniref:Lipoprotein n=1 Tax=Paracoccus marinaquae TaxID=2841926 RepID=A0ABS6AQ68_9RHOB|nr:hypothetical protein [Paracoccus marinaquae]MBU3032002.1 hypothetical protein [Paracoccus marinaquae]